MNTIERKQRAVITPQELSERLAYDPTTGALSWKKCRDSSKVGKQTCSIDAYGYVQVNVRGQVLKGHRIAWAIHFGHWPDGHIDHVNGIRHDNRLENLRVLSNRANCENQRNGVRKNATGYIGVFVSKRSHPDRMYRAKIEVDGEQIHLGGFPTPEEAHQAYLDAKRKHHSACTI